MVADELAQQDEGSLGANCTATPACSWMLKRQQRMVQHTDDHKYGRRVGCAERAYTRTATEIRHRQMVEELGGHRGHARRGMA